MRKEAAGMGVIVAARQPTAASPSRPANFQAPNGVACNRPTLVAEVMAGAWTLRIGATQAREPRMMSRRRYWMAVTRRVSARRLSLIAAMAPAPPGIVPRKEVAA